MLDILFRPSVERALLREEKRRSAAIKAAADLLPNQSGVHQLGGEIGRMTRLQRLASLAPTSEQGGVYGWYIQETPGGRPLDISVFHGGTVTVAGYDGSSKRVFMSYTLGDEKPEIHTENLGVTTDTPSNPYIDAINTTRPPTLALLPIFPTTRHRR